MDKEEKGRRLIPRRGDLAGVAFVDAEQLRASLRSFVGAVVRDIRILRVRWRGDNLADVIPETKFLGSVDGALVVRGADFKARRFQYLFGVWWGKIFVVELTKKRRVVICPVNGNTIDAMNRPAIKSDDGATIEALKDRLDQLEIDLQKVAEWRTQMTRAATIAGAELVQNVFERGLEAMGGTTKKRRGRPPKKQPEQAAATSVASPTADTESKRSES